MIEKSARRFRGGAPFPGLHAELHPARGGLLVSIDEGQRLFKSVHEFDGAPHDAHKGVVARPRHSTGTRGRLGPGQEFVEVQIEAGQRSHEVARTPVGAHGVKRRGMRHVLLQKNVLKFRRVDIQARGRNDAPLVHGVLGGMCDRDELILRCKIREGEARNPGHGFQGSLQAPNQIIAELGEFPPPGHFVEAPHAD